MINEYMLENEMVESKELKIFSYIFDAIKNGKYKELINEKINEDNILQYAENIFDKLSDEEKNNINKKIEEKLSL